MATLDELRYPIGRFARPDEISPARIAAWIEDLERLPAALRAAVEPLNEKQLGTPYRPDGWTVRQVVHHLADSHMNSVLRFKWALAENRPTIKDYQEDRWAELPDYSAVPVATSLRLLEALHERWVGLLRALNTDDWQREFVHPESGPIRLDLNTAIYAWHGRHHVAHITRLAEREGWSHARRSGPLVALLLCCALAGGCSKKTEDKSSGTTIVSEDVTPPPGAVSWQVTERGVGPVRIGMTVAQAESALATRFDPAPSGACATVRPAHGPAGLSFMVVQGLIARIDIVDSTESLTATGARVGDTEARVQELYPGRVTVSPHKYTDGHYLTVGPLSPDDSAYRIIFETDGTRVTRFRSGRLPEVEWVEGCS